MKPVAIIGSGLAGYTVAREFRKLDKTTPVLIITGDDGGFYSKPMLSNAFAQGKTASHLRSQTADQMAAQINATILTRTQVRGIDTTKQTVHTSAGEFEFSQLVLAVGAQAIRLPFAGNAADQVLSVNTLDDYAVLRDRLSAAGASARVAIIGAGLIGCEFADDLSTGGHQVTLIDPESSTAGGTRATSDFCRITSGTASAARGAPPAAVSIAPTPACGSRWPTANTLTSM
jgi:rubredoxin-NAD+ reductase